MAPPGYLFVFADPGAGVTDEEFQDWYNNEHVPLRVDIPAFQSWTRWKAADGEKPTWAASYDLASYEATLTPPYTTLAETRSEREKSILGDLKVMERRTYELKDSPLPPPSALFNEHKPSRYIVAVSIDVKAGGEAILDKWYDEEHIPMLSKVPGWVRSRRFVLKDWARSGTEGKANQQPVPRFFAVHEWESVDAVQTPEVQDSFNTPLKAQVDPFFTAWDVRVLDYYRHWERK